MVQYYTGLDVSMDETNIATVDDHGNIVFESSTKTDPQSLHNVLRAAGFPIQKISLESGSWSHWLVKELTAFGWKITCIDARSIAPQLNLNTNKTDRNDARGIAEAVRINSKSIKEVYQKSQESVEMQTLLSARRLLVGQRTALNNAIKGLLKTYGLSLVGAPILEKVQAKIEQQWASDSSQPPVLALEKLSLMFEKIAQEILIIDHFLNKLVKEDELIKRLMTAPGVGQLTAITYKVVIDNPHRFKKPRLVGAYLGMCPKQYSSGKTKRMGRISKKGSQELRNLLSSAGMKLLTHCKQDSLLRTWGLKIAEKHGKKKASVAIGRKLAIILLQIWRNNTIFSPEK